MATFAVILQTFQPFLDSFFTILLRHFCLLTMLFMMETRILRNIITLMEHTPSQNKDWVNLPCHLYAILLEWGW